MSFLKISTSLLLASSLISCGGSAKISDATDPGTVSIADTGKGMVSGMVSGLPDGEQVSLLNKGADPLTISKNGAFSFATPSGYNGSYVVTVDKQPKGKICTVTNSSGVGIVKDIKNVGVICSSLTYTVSGKISGLSTGQQVTLNNNSADALVLTSNGVRSNGDFTFTTAVAANSSYAVTIGTQPTGQICTATNGSGNGVVADITDVNVVCSNNTYTISGTISGLTQGQQVTLTNNNTDAKIYTSNGSFRFATPVSHNSGYVVTVGTQPTGQTCTIANGSGYGVVANIANVSVTCSASAYTISGTISGLTEGQQVTLNNNNADAKVYVSNGRFSFTTPVTYNSAYSVTVGTQPTAQTCTVTNNSGSNVAANVDNVAVTCSTSTYTISGTISGLTSGQQITLKNNGANTTTFDKNGSFVFDTPISYNAGYAVTLVTQPITQICKLSNAAGTNVTANVTNVSVSCSTSADGSSANVVPQTQFLPDTAFNTNDFPSDTTGDLPGMVLFAQNQIIPATVRIANDVQPHLSGLRDTLVMFKVKPELLIPNKGVSIKAYDANNQLLGSSVMAAPTDIPKQPNFLPNVDLQKLTFVTQLSSKRIVITGNSTLEKLNDPDAVYLKSLLSTNDEIQIEMSDGNWTRNVYLPEGNYKGKNIVIHSVASSSTTVSYKNAKGDSLGNEIWKSSTPFTFVNTWISPNDLVSTSYVYGHDFWSSKLPAQWLAAGLRLEFWQGDKVGKLDSIRVGAPTELLIHTIDIGMLTTPRGGFSFAGDTNAHREYFQTIPASRFVVSNYESAYFTEVMMPNGTLFKDVMTNGTLLKAVDPSVGGYYGGDMREVIGKGLISVGIDNANYGIASSTSFQSQPYLAAQLAAHNSVGNYSNGRQVHGLSGGNGIVTLYSSIGNEFSHEVGHNYGLGHYPGGAAGTIQHPANAANSTWGWDSKRNEFVPSFSQGKNSQTECYPDASVASNCVQAFDGHNFSWDAMGGGSPKWPINRFTMYTPYSMSTIQNFLESKIVFAKDSPTGFRKWNATKSVMEDYTMQVPYLSTLSASIGQLGSDGSYIQSLFDQKADVVYVSMGNGNWTQTFYAPAASLSNQGKYISVQNSAQNATNISINGSFTTINKWSNQAYLSDGSAWKPVDFINTNIARKPELFGVPVTTLVGFYDPKATLTSYVYPALHGAYGFVYADDHSSLTDSMCQLRVTTKFGERRYRLSNVRFDGNLMNRFQVNIPESEVATSASVHCNGTELVKRDGLLPAQSALTPSVNGVPLP